MTEIAEHLHTMESIFSVIWTVTARRFLIWSLIGDLLFISPVLYSLIWGQRCPLRQSEDDRNSI